MAILSVAKDYLRLWFGLSSQADVRPALISGLLQFVNLKRGFLISVPPAVIHYFLSCKRS